MSETVHYKGKLIPTGKTLKEFDPETSDIYDHYLHAVEIDGMVYVVKKKDIDPDGDILRSTKNEDGTIDFEVRYYNGGCSFNEAIEEALKNNS